MKEVGAELRQAREHAVVDVFASQLVLQHLDAVLDRSLQGQIAVQQMVPDFVEQEARAAGEAHEVAGVVAPSGSEELDRIAVDRQKQGACDHDVDARQLETVAARPAPRDHHVQVALVARVLGRRFVGERLVDHVGVEQGELREQPPRFFAVRGVNVDPNETAALRCLEGGVKR
jgi:hypothetical protein